MTAAVAPATHGASVPSLPHVRLAAALAVTEARLLLRSPFFLVGFSIGMAILVTGSRSSDRGGWEAATTGAPYAAGPMCIAAGYFAVLRWRRAGSGGTSLATALPAPAATRVVGLLLATLVPALVVWVPCLFAVLVLEVHGSTPPPVLAELAAVPLLCAGGGALGVMTGRWFRRLWALPLLLVVVFVGTAVMNESSYEPVALFAPYVTYDPSGAWAGRNGIDPELRSAYLAALIGAAWCGALLPDARRRAVPLLAGGVCCAVALLTGLQLLR